MITICCVRIFYELFSFECKGRFVIYFDREAVGKRMWPLTLPRGQPEMDDDRVQPPPALLVVAPGALSSNSVIVQSNAPVGATTLSELAPGKRNFRIFGPRDHRTRVHPQWKSGRGMTLAGHALTDPHVDAEKFPENECKTRRYSRREWNMGNLLTLHVSAKEWT